jgi:hypothetical protein
VASSCDHGNELLASIKGGQFLSYWTNCAFGLYPSSGVSKNKQNWGIKNIDKISQHTRPQYSHKGQLLTTEQLTWAHTHINPWSKSDTGGNKWPSHWGCSVVSNWPLCEFCGCVYCDILSIFLIPQFFCVLRHQTMDKVQKHNSFNTNTPSSESYRNHLILSINKIQLRSCGLWRRPQRKSSSP